jgi:cell division transport system permease protein
VSVNRGLRRSLSDFKIHPWLHLASIGTIAISLVILGIFFLCYRNFEYISEKASPTLTGTVYLKDALIDSEISRVKEKILSLENVKKVTFKPKRTVVDELQVFLGATGAESLPGSELFPDVLEVELKKETSSNSIATLKSVLTRYSEVDFSEDWLVQYKKVRQFLKIFGFVLLIGILFGCGFVIANFMGMRHQSRKNEIEIVNLMGAHRNFILTPFVWEGLIEGICGTLVALVFLVIVKAVVSTAAISNWSSFLGVKELLYLSFGQVLILLIVGIATALVGGITVFLRFQENTGR